MARCARASSVQDGDVEQDAALGGTCLHRGCIPTKALLHAADLLSEMQHAKDFGLAVENPRVDMAALAAYRNRVVLKNAKGVEFLMKKNKVDVLHGRGKLAGAGKVTVTGADGAARTVATKNVILASGSTVRALPGFEFDRKQIISSDQALTLERIPKSMVVLGAGAVGSSSHRSITASIPGDLGGVVPRVLPVEDEEVSAELEKIFKKQGIQVLTGTRPSGWRRPATSSRYSGRDGQAQVILVRCSWWWWAAGR
jgi:dihydrolipoamide dehydrogenase